MECSMTKTTTMDRQASVGSPSNQHPDIIEVAPSLPAGLPKGLRNYWYPVLQSEELPAGKPVGFMALSEPLVAWRDATGNPCVARDRCPHRSIKLSIGRVYDGNLQCILHGLRFNGEGRCIMVPWEEEQDDRKKLPAAIAYPARELGGYIWAYLGDTTSFPAPPLENEVPEELSKPDEFIWFRLPTEIWNANWLLSVDGSDAFHAVVLHASSQAVTGKTWTGGKAEHAEVPLHERRMKIVKTSHGIRGVALDAGGNPLHHGHFTVDVKGDRFVLPCLSTNPIMPAPGAAPYTSRLWQFAVDETRTHVARYAVWRARSAEEREKATRVFHDLALPRLQKVSAEDAFAAEAQGDVVTARQDEHLLSPDVDVVGVRRLLRKAFVSPISDRKRVEISKAALLYPL
jgi:phenylpropionate dioxygenase-like ring-hydroxylating dioxygenase large terminal subunit